MFAMRLAVATEDFGSTLRTAIHKAADAGAVGVRLNTRTEVRPDQFTDTALRQLRLLIAERQMKVAGLLFPSRRSLYEQENLERRLDGVRRVMVQAQKLGTSEVLIRCGRIPSPMEVGGVEASAGSVPTDSDVDSLANPFSFAAGQSSGSQRVMTSAEQFTMLVEILDDLTRYGNHVGCTLQLQVASYDKSLVTSLMSAVSGGPLQVVFDPATAVMTCSDPVKVFRDLYRYVGYIRARDAIRDVDGAGVEVALGDGIVDWTQLIPTLSEADFRGWMCVERGGGDHRAEDVCSGIARLNAVVGPF